MSGLVEKRVLSTGDALVFTADRASMIFVGRNHAGRLGEGAAALEHAKTLLTAGQAKDFSGADVKHINKELSAIGLLMPLDSW